MWINEWEGARSLRLKHLDPSHLFFPGSTDIEKLSTYRGTHAGPIPWSRNSSQPPLSACLTSQAPRAWIWPLTASQSWLWHLSAHQDSDSLSTARSSWWAGLLQSPVWAGTVHLWWFLCPCQLSPCNLCSWVDTATDTPSPGVTDSLASWLKKPLVTE